MEVYGDILEHHAEIRPDQIALKFEDRAWTYLEYHKTTNKVANALVAEGLKPASRVAILSANTDRFFELQFGTAKCGTVLVPVNFRLAPPEVAFVVNDATAEVLFVDQTHAEIIEKIAGDLTTVKKIIALDFTHPEWQDFTVWRDAHGDQDCGVEIDPTSTAVQMYTSGTTGHPKGVELTHRNTLEMAPIVTKLWGDWQPEDVNLVCMPLFHIAGGGWGVCGFYSGMTNILHREVDPALILKTIPAEKVNIALFVPAVILFLTQQPDIADTDFSSLRMVVYGASPIPVDLVKQAVAIFGCEFAQVYGLTETTGAITFLGPEEHLAGGPNLKSCGRVHPGVELRIVDDNSNDVPVGDVGEIICRSKQVMKGYWARPEANAKSIRDNWFYTGDAGYLDEDGYLYIHDRIKDMIVSGGENVYPAEVESALFAHDAITDVAVIGVPSEKWGEEVKAIVVTDEGKNLSDADVIAFARERVAGYKVPKSVDFIDALPRNPSGKILKRELRKPYWEGRDRQVN